MTAPTQASPTPTAETDALFARHVAEAEGIKSEVARRNVAVRQVKELLAHARRLERQRDRLVEALTRLSRVPLEDFGWEKSPSQPLHGWNGYYLYASDVLKARAALAEVKGKS